MTHIFLKLLLVVALSEASKLPEDLNTRCVRKEYRMLSLREREKFHEAINYMKKAGTFDELVQLHKDLSSTGHWGPGFVGWHRVYLLRFESALQEIDPEVCLPFWDSRIDSRSNALKSSLWTDEYLGNVGGVVNSGPFAGWKDFNGDPLTRTHNLEADCFGCYTFTHHKINKYMESAKRNDDLIDTLEDLEGDHGGVHMFVGGRRGQMANALISPSDPVFLLHHTFVDYVWEKFREVLRNNSRDPEQYPGTTDREHDDFRGHPIFENTHSPNATLGLGYNLTQADAYLDEMRPYTYVDPPSCPIRKKLYHYGIDLGNMLKPECTMPNTYCVAQFGHCFAEIKEENAQTTNQSLTSDEDTVKNDENDGTDSEENVTPNEVHQTTQVPADANDVFEWLQLKEMLRSLSEE